MKFFRTAVVFILCFLCIAASYFFGARAQTQKNQQFAAETLVKSFGWQIDQSKSIDSFHLSAQNFRDDCFHISGADAVWPPDTERASRVVISGIPPAILRTDFRAQSGQEVSVFEIPVVFPMPEGCNLVAKIAFTEDTICMSCVQVKFANVQLAAEKLSALSESEQAKLVPSVWPLDTDKHHIEAWKSDYRTLVSK